MNSDRKRILLVEPEPVLTEITAFRLELLGYGVTSVPSAEEALARVAEVTPDLIITDLILQGTDGTGLIERLASDEETSDIPILVLSTDADLDRVERIYDLGAADFIVVPYHPEVLEEKVAKHLANARPGKQSRAKATPVQ